MSVVRVRDREHSLCMYVCMYILCIERCDREHRHQGAAEKYAEIVSYGSFFLMHAGSLDTSKQKRRAIFIGACMMLESPDYYSDER